jgi:hypothetical protein
MDAEENTAPFIGNETPAQKGFQKGLRSEDRVSGITQPARWHRTSTTPTGAERDFTQAQLAALTRLRASYQLDHDLFSREEVKRLEFLRWLYRTSRLAS